ncbi:MAG: hypothetical protein ACP5E3_13390 [Bacteroidales bacterium]
MDDKQIKKLANTNKLPGASGKAEIKETHISWLILYKHFVYKIKKPVKYSFVDFSTLEKREYYCKEEIRLNTRLAPHMYLDVIEICNDMLASGTTSDRKILDYAVQMKRMDNKLEMDRLLEKDKVTKDSISSLAKKITDFHDRVDIVRKKFNRKSFQKMYSDIENQQSYVQENLGDDFGKKIEDSISKSEDFLANNEELMDTRVENGFRKDCHGDLNSHNIFLYDDPVVFDCIEFNKDFRYIDVLNEIAFLCVDLDFYKKENLGNLFYEKYLEFSSQEHEEPLRKLFQYYKSYRANVRAKVTLISAEEKGKENNKKELEDACFYLNLMNISLGKF